MIQPLLRSQEECAEWVRQCVYVLPARLRKGWKEVWKHLYESPQ